jgi:hypothetical protein
MFQSLNFIQLFNGQSSYGIYDSTADVSVEGTENVGGLIGMAYGPQGNGVFAIVSNSSSSGTVKGIRYIGGLIGFAYDLSIENSNSDVFLGPRVNLINNGYFGDVYSDSSYSFFGGLVGYAASGGSSQLMTINNSYFDGVIDFTLDVPDDNVNPFFISRVGGLIGFAYEYVNINDSYSTGSILIHTMTNENNVNISNIGGFIGFADDRVFIGLGEHNHNIILGKFADGSFVDLNEVPLVLEEEFYYYDVENFKFHIYLNDNLELVDQHDNNFSLNDYNSYSDTNIEIVMETNAYISASLIGGFIGLAEETVVLYNILSKGTIKLDVSSYSKDDNDNTSSNIVIQKIGGIIGDAENTNIYNSSSYVEIIVLVSAIDEDSNVNSDYIGGAIGYYENTSQNINSLLNVNSSGSLLINIEPILQAEPVSVNVSRVGGLVGEADATSSPILIYGSNSSFDIIIDSINTNDIVSVYEIGGFAGRLRVSNNGKIEIFGSASTGNITFESIVTDRSSIYITDLGGFIGLVKDTELKDVTTTTNIEFKEILINNNTTFGIDLFNLGGLIGRTLDYFKFDKLVVDADIKLAVTNESEDDNRKIDIYNVSGMFGFLETNIENLHLLEFNLNGSIEIEAFNNFDENIYIFNIGSLIGDLFPSLEEIEAKFELSTPTIEQYAILIKISDDVINPALIKNINKFVGEYENFTFNELVSVDPQDISVLITDSFTLS